MRKAISLSAVIAAATLLTACNNSAESLYASGPWWPGVASPYPEYADPLVSPKPFDLDTLQDGDVEPRVYGLPGRPVRVEVDISAEPAPYDPQVYRDAPIIEAPLPEIGGPAPQAAPAPSREAALPPATRTIAPPSRRPSAYTGSWKAVDANGASCRVQLSSVPTLDLYKASSSGCANEKLKSVNAWSYKDGQLTLFSRGNVVARLTGFEASLSGSFNGSGDGLKMTR
jgi:hypothetical protein